MIKHSLIFVLSQLWTALGPPTQSLILKKYLLTQFGKTQGLFLVGPFGNSFILEKPAMETFFTILLLGFCIKFRKPFHIYLDRGEPGNMAALSHRQSIGAAHHTKQGKGGTGGERPVNKDQGKKKNASTEDQRLWVSLQMHMHINAISPTRLKRRS